MSDYEILTYRQIAERLGISPESARKKVRRRKWRVVPGNRVSDPVRVHVPVEVLAAGRAEADPEDDAPSGATDSELLSTLKALEGYVSRVSGHQDRLLAELGRLLSDLAAKDAAHAAALDEVRAEERERYREELAAITSAYEEVRTERLDEINRLVSDIERERTARTEEGKRYHNELDRQWQTFLEERERYFEDLERERMTTARAEARAYRSEAAAKDMRDALVTVVPRMGALLRPAATEPDKSADKPEDKPPSAEDNKPPIPSSLLKGPAGSPDDADSDKPDKERRRGWWPWGRR